jgi:WD40 repeat protein/tRNA A-37 threonylcarbamoyl transferase component Bud32
MDELGRGGMGIVYRARQRSLEREVALKRLIPGKAGRGEQRQFLAEALVTGVLDHPNIVSVHDLGRTADGDIFLAMKLVNGTCWLDLLHPRDDAERAKAAKLDIEAHIRILLEVGNAVAFAHAKGIVHRDLKPANVMVGDFGEVLVMDWGIAVDVRERPGPESMRVPHRTSVTTPGGTPCYMPPELAVGKGRDIGPATDVFLLGAILHEIVTGHPPHEGESLINVLHQAIECAPKRYGPDVPAALQAILHRAMAKEPLDRYPDVRAFRAALEDYLAHRQSVKIAETAEATLAACGPAPSTAAGAAGREATLERNRRYGAFAEAVAGFRQALLLWSGNEAARRGEERARVAFARAALEAGDLGLAGAQASALTAGNEERARLEGEIAGVAAARSQRERASRRVRRALQASVAVIVIGLAAGIALVRSEQRRAVAERDRAQSAEAEAARERDRARLEAWNGRVEMAHAFYERALGLAAERRYQSAEASLLRALEIAPRGGAPPGFRASWDAPGWAEEAWRLHRAFFALCPREARRLDAPPVTFTAAAVGRSGRHALLGDAEGRIHVFDLSSGTRTAEVPSSARAPVHDLALSPDGTLAAALTSYGALRVIDVEAEREVRSLGGPEWGFLCAAVWTLPPPSTATASPQAATGTARPSPPGPRLFAGGSDRKVWLFDLESGHALWQVDTDDGGPPRTPASICVSPDGALGLVGLWDGSARLFDLASGRQLRAFWGAMHWVSAVAFDREGKTVWLGSDDGLVRRIELESGRELARIQTDDVRGIRISQDARSALVLRRGGGAEVLALDRGEKSSEIERCGPAPVVVAPSADGTSAVLAFEEGPPRVYDLARALRRPRRLSDLAPEGDPIAALAVSPDRRRFLTASEAGVVTLRELRRRREVLRLEGLARGARALAFSSDGKAAALGTEGGTATVIALEGGAVRWTRDLGAGPVTSVEFLEADALVAAGAARAVVFLEAASGRERSRLPAPPGGFTRARLAPGGRRLAAASGERVYVYDLDSPGPPRRLDALAPVHAAEVSADGEVVAAACEDRAVRVFDVASGRVARRIEAFAAPATDLVLLADGRTAIAAARDRTLCVLDVANGTVMRRLRVREDARAAAAAALAPAGRAEEEDGLAAIAVSRDGAYALGASEEGEVLMWPLLDPDVPALPPADLGPVYEVVGLRVAVEGEGKGAIEPYQRAAGAPR